MGVYDKSVTAAEDGIVTAEEKQILVLFLIRRLLLNLSSTNIQLLI
jgi:hypothetical protein